MALPLLPILLLFGAGAGVVALVAAKNVRGEDVKVGERAMRVRLLDNKGNDAGEGLLVGFEDVFEGTPSSNWEWIVPNWNDESDSPYGGGQRGVAPTRKQAFNAGFTTLVDSDPSILGLDADPTTSGLQIDFLNHDAKVDMRSKGWGEDLIFRVSIIPTSSGWLTQVTDPSATVKFLKTFPSRSAAISAGYGFVEKAGY